MASLSNDLENLLINHVFRNVPYTPAATIHVALYSSDPKDDNSGTELSGAGYVRKSFTVGAPTNGVAHNGADILFDTATADWNTVTHVAVYSANSGGTMLVHGALATPITVLSGDNFRIAASNLAVTFQ